MRRENYNTVLLFRVAAPRRARGRTPPLADGTPPLRGGSSRVSPVSARARGRRPADDGRERSGAATDERAVDGRDAARRR